MYRFPDAGQVRRFELADDQYAEKQPDGRTILKSPAPSAAGRDIRHVVRERARATGRNIRLVLYPAGRKRTEANRREVTRRIVIESNNPAEVNALAAQYGLVNRGRRPYAKNYWILEAEDSAEALDAAEQIMNESTFSVYPLLARQQSKRGIPNDTLFGNQWHLANTGQAGGAAGIDVNVTNVWDDFRGEGIFIGIVDDGLETGHEDLAGNVNTAIDWDFNGNDANPSPGVGDDHGTCVAGVAAAVGSNALGVCGVAYRATLVGLRLTGLLSTDAEEAGSVSHSNDIIYVKNNSWGPYDDAERLEGPGPLTRAALSNSVIHGRGGKGTLHVWAAGNGRESYDNVNYDGYANSIYTIAVGAVGDNGQTVYYGEPGAPMVVCAPSDDGSHGITTTDRTGSSGYVSGNYESNFGGTSSSAPLAAGIVALIVQANTNLGWRDVQEILIRTAVKNHPSDTNWFDNAAGFHFNPNYGAGMIDAEAAVETALTWTHLAAPSRFSVSSNALSMAIPDDNAAGVTVKLTVTQENFRIEHVQITPDITHTYRGDLEMRITSPGGTMSILTEAHGDGDNNYSGWTLMSVQHWGESGQGEWTFNVRDSFEVDTGTLNAVALTFHGVQAEPNNGDSDGDGIDDDWEITYSGSITNMDETTDSDDDGFPDLHEFLAGTVPTNTLSLLDVNGLPPRADTNIFILQWPSVTGRQYHVQRTLSIPDGFTTIESNISATAPLNTYTDSTIGVEDRYFYRIRLNP